MTFAPINSLPYQVPENIVFSEDQDQLLIQLTDYHRKIAKASNSKDVGQYALNEVLNGQTYFTANVQKFTNVYRKVIECGALPNAALKQVAHGIAGIGNAWMFTRIYGTAREPAGVAPRPYFIPLPNAGPNYQVELMVDTTNINITTAVNLSAFAYSIVVLEYIKA